MPNDTSTPKHFAAVLVENGRERPLGTVALDAAGMLSTDGPTASEQDAGVGKLQRMISEMNATKVMHIDVPPREGAPEFTLASAIIKRGDPRFVTALKEQARTYYGIELREP